MWFLFGEVSSSLLGMGYVILLWHSLSLHIIIFKVICEKNLEKSHFGQIQVQFVFSTESNSDSVMREHLLCIHISHLSHWTAL